jgi:anti-sigma-K factor RskA
VNGSHEHWDELAAGYALHALEPDEEQELRVHLRSCDRCRSTLDEHRLVAAQLGALAEDSDVRPPSWQAIRAGVVTDRPTPVLPGQRRGRIPARLLAAAAAVVVLGAGGVLGWRISDSHTLAPGLAALERCDTSSGCVTIRLQVDGRSPAALLVQDGAARMVPTGLAQPPRDHAYALWQLPRDGRPVLVAEMPSVPAQVSAPVSLALPYEDTAAFAVSVEPTDVVPSKPTRVLAVGTAA